MKASAFFSFAILLATALCIWAPASAAAAGYPDRPIQLVNPHVAGALGDITARLLAEELEKILNTKIIPSNKPGAGTVLGVDAVLRGKKDGYTLLYTGSSAFVYAPNANPEVVHYDPAKDAEPLGVHCFLHTVVGVKADAPWKNLGELVDYARKNPGKLRVSSIGVGSSTHFQIEVLQAATGIKLTHVPFEGGESTVTAVLGNHVELTVDGFAKLKPHMESGRMRILAIDPKRPVNPEIPTLRELGYKQSLPSTWFAMFAPAGIPEEVKRVLVPAIEKAVKLTKPRIEQLGSICDYRSPAEQRKLRDDEYKQVYEVAVRTGLRKP
jgi:tripartite-type tricarboxylate transporter receptor subunit TctC